MICRGCPGIVDLQDVTRCRVFTVSGEQWRKIKVGCQRPLLESFRTPIFGEPAAGLGLLSESEPALMQVDRTDEPANLGAVRGLQCCTDRQQKLELDVMRQILVPEVENPALGHLSDFLCNRSAGMRAPRCGNEDQA
jgi:hypothetical protein